MANRVQYTIGFGADTREARKAIQDLGQALDKAISASSGRGILDEDIKQASKAAKELQVHLQKAFNQNTGKLDLSAFNKSLKDAGQNAESLMNRLVNGGAAGQQAFYALASSIAQSEVPLKRVNSTLRDFATTLKNTVKWELSSNIVHGLEGALSGAVSYAKNLNTSLTNIRIVTGQTVEDMAKFTKEANAAAKELSTTTKAYADAALIYYQQGDSQEMVAKKAAITIKAANSSFGTTAAEMSEYLTAVWNSYQVGADELERYVDIMASLGAKTATSLEEIATSMQKVAATANTVGVSMEQVSSIIATVSSVTRESAESIGTSYKTIFARIGDLKLGGADEDGVGLGLVSSQLDAIGVSIMDTNGELRDMGDIIMELGNKWQTMSGATKTAVAQAVAGKRQYTQLMALFENWDMFMENLGTAENATGSLDQMASIYEESWEAASNRARAALEGIYNQIIDDQGLIKITDGVAAFTEQVGDTIQMLGGIPGVLTTIGNIGSKVFKDQIANSLDKTISNLNIFMSQFKSNKKILDTLKNIKSVSQLQYQKDLQEASEDIDSTSLSSGEKNKDALVIQNARALITLKQDLINNEHKLTQAQKEQYLARMDQLSAQGAELVKQAAVLDELASAERRLAAQARVSTQKANVKKEIVGAGVSRVAIANEVNKNSQAQKFLSAFQQGSDATAYVNAIQKLSAAWGMVDAAQAKALKIEDAEKLTSIFNTLRKSLTETVGNETILKRLKMDAIDSKNALEDLQNQLIEVVPALEEALRSSLPDTDKPIIDALSENAFNKGRSSITLGFGEDFFKEEFKGFKNFFKEGIKDSKTFGQTIAIAGSAVMSLVSGIQTAYSSAKIFGDESATAFDKLQAGASIATQAIMGFQNGFTFGVINTAVLIFTSFISHFNAEAERAIQLLDENYRKAYDKISSRSEENKEIGNLTSRLIILNEQKLQGLEVDKQISEISSQLAEKYDIEGTAVQNLTQDYINLAKAQAGEITNEAIDARALALDNIKRNANLDIGFYDPADEIGPYGEVYQTYTEGVKFTNAYSTKSQNMEGANFTLDDFLKENPQYADLFTDRLNGSKLLKWDNNAEGEEKIERYDLLKDFVSDLREANVSATDAYLNGIVNQIAKLEPEMAEIDFISQEAFQSLTNELGLDLIGKTVESYEDYFSLFDQVETALKAKDAADTDLNLSDEETRQIVFDTLDFTEKGKTLGSVIQNTINKLSIDIETAKKLTEEATNIIENLGAEQSDIDENVLNLLSTQQKGLASKTVQANKEAREYGQLAKIDTKMDQVSKLLSEDITSENYTAMKKAYQEAYELAEGNMLTWEEFIAMNKDAQEAYIASIPTKVLDDQIVAKTEERNAREIEYNSAKNRLDTIESLPEFNKETAVKEQEAYLNGEKEFKDLDPIIQNWILLQETITRTRQEIDLADASLEDLSATKEFQTVRDQALSFEKALSSIPQSLEEVGKMSDVEFAILADNIKTLTGEVVDFSNMSDKDILRTALIAQAEGIEQEIKDAQALLDSATDAQTRIAGEEAVAEAYQKQRENKEALIALDNQLLQASKNRHAQEVAQTEKEIEQLKKAADYFGSGNELTNAQRAEISAAPGGENLLKQWDSATSAAERYAITVQTIEAANEREVGLLNNQKKLIDGIADTLKLWQSELAKSVGSADEFASKLKELGYNDNFINQVKELYESLDLTGIEDPNEIFQLLINAAKKAGLEIENELALMNANLIDALTETSNNYAKALQEDAEKTVDAWRDAFDTILALKEGLASGKTMAEIIMGDPKQFADTLGQMQVALGNTFDMTKAITDENYLAQMLEKSGLLTYDPVSQNRAVYGEKSYYNQNGQKMSLEEYQRTMMENNQFNNGDEAKESYYSQAAFESLNQMSVEAEQAAASLDNVQTAFESYKGVVEDTTSIAHGLNQAETERLQEAVKNAQEAKADGKTMQDLEEEDRRLLEQNGITFENLDIAAVDCTTALAQLAEAALNAAKVQAEKEGYVEAEDGSWHKSATADELREQGLYSKYSLTDEAKAQGWEYHGIDEEGNVVYRLAEEAEQLTELLQGKQQEVDTSVGDIQDTFYQQNQYDVEAATRQMDAVGAYNEAGADVEKQASAIKDLREAYTGLEDCQEIIDQLEQGTKDWDEANRELTTTALSQVKSVNKLSDSQFDLYKQHLKNNNVVADGFDTTEEYIEALEKQRKEYKKNIKAGEDFVKTIKKEAKESKKLSEAIGDDGTIDNFEDLRKAIAEMANIDPVNFKEMFDGMEPDVVGELFERMATAAQQGADSASEALRQAFNQMDSTLWESGEQIFMACGATAEQATQAADMLEEAIHTTGITPAVWEAICDLIPNFDASALVDTLNQTVSAAKGAGFEIDSGIMEAIGAFSNLSGTRGGSKTRGGYTPRRSGSGRGGSGGGKGGGKKPELKEIEGDELEHIESIIEDIANQVDKAASMAERSFGKQHIKDIEKQVDALKQQIGALNQKIQMLYSQMNMKMAEFSMHVAAASPQFDELAAIVQYDANGMIINMDEVIQKAIQMATAIAAAAAAGQISIEEANKQLDMLNPIIATGQEVSNIRSEISAAQAQIADLENQILDLNLEKIMYEIEYQVDINEDDLAIIDYYNAKMEDSLKDQGNIMQNLVDSTWEYVDNLQIYQDAIGKLQTAYDNGEISQAGFAEGLQEVEDGLLDNLHALLELEDEIKAVFKDTLDMASDEIERFTDLIESGSEAMTSFIEIQGLLGNATNYEALQKFYDERTHQDMESLKAQMDYLEVLKEQEKYYQDRLEKNGELGELEQQQYWELQEVMAEVQDNILDKTEETLENIQESFENTINGIFKNLDKNMAGAAGSLANLADDYSYYLEVESRYVTQSRELYEISKLNRQINQQMDDVTTEASKAKLKALQDEINLKSQSQQLTEYDLQLMQLEYEKTLAMIALEEAQNAKDTVRLTRDADGNYVYQYTANEDQVAEKQQQYEDKLIEINDLTLNRTQEMEQMFVDLLNDYHQAAMEIAMNTELTVEERNEALEKLNERFHDSLMFIQEQYNISTEDLLDSNLDISEHFSEELQDQVFDTKEGINKTLELMIDDANRYSDMMKEVVGPGGLVQGTLSDYQKYMDEVAKLTKTDYDNMGAAAVDYSKKADAARKESKKFVDYLASALGTINSATAAWVSMAGSLDAVRASAEAAVAQVQALIKALAELESAESEEDGGGGGGGSTTPPATESKKDTSSSKKKSSNSSTTKKTSSKAEVTVYESSNSKDKTGNTKTTPDNNDVIILKDKNTGYQKEITMMKTGGINVTTGWHWLDGTLSRPELVLNADDTQNMLSIVDMLHSWDNGFLGNIFKTLDVLTGLNLSSMFNASTPVTPVATTQNAPVEQVVQITAEFPAAEDRNEIKAAFDDLINQASQFVNRRFR